MFKLSTLSFYILLLGFVPASQSAPPDSINPLSSITHGVIVDSKGNLIS